jgi:uncharacterized damage-inducible protein DinB
MISQEMALRHMAWSNEAIFRFFGGQDDSVFGLRATDGEWPIGRLLTHLVGSSEWYRYCLSGVRWTDLKPITSGAIALEYIPVLKELDDFLISQAALADELLAIDADGETIHATRALILAQAPSHAAEHKGQMAAIMKKHGRHLDLDSLDVWSYYGSTQSK